MKTKREVRKMLWYLVGGGGGWSQVWRQQKNRGSLPMYITSLVDVVTAYSAPSHFFELAWAVHGLIHGKTHTPTKALAIVPLETCLITHHSPLPLKGYIYTAAFLGGKLRRGWVCKYFFSCQPDASWKACFTCNYHLCEKLNKLKGTVSRDGFGFWWHVLYG